jgi:peroxiredoxin
MMPLVAATPAYPTVGEKAPDFALSTPEGKTVRLSDVMLKGPVVLVVLRGYPGYQCPYCNRQVQDFIRSSSRLAGAGARVVMVYPGPPQDLGTRANEFLGDKKLPDNFDLVLDPGHEFTNLYRLRWEASGETAYPSTFLINQRGVIFFSKIAKEHGGRATAAEIIAALAKGTAAK